MKFGTSKQLLAFAMICAALAPIARADDTSDQNQPYKRVKVEATADAVVNHDVNDHSNGGVGAVAGASVTIHPPEGEDKPTMTITGSFGKVGDQLVGGGSVELNTDRHDPGHIANLIEPTVRVGANASNQLVDIPAVLMGISVGTSKDSELKIYGRLPIVGGVVLDRENQAGLLATGLRIEGAFKLLGKLSGNAHMEGDYLWFASKGTNGVSPDNGIYLDLGVGAKYAFNRHFALTADGGIEDADYKACETGGQTVELKRVGITGKGGMVLSF